MKKTLFFIMLGLLSLSSRSQTDSIQKKNRKVHVIVHAGIGGAVSTDLVSFGDGGVGCRLGGAVEFPLHPDRRWHVSVGINFYNTNIQRRPSLEYTAPFFGRVTLYLMNHSFFMQLPVLFSYTRPLDARCDFRLSFGVFLSQYLGGLERYQGFKTSGYVEDEVTVYHDEFIQNPFNAGIAIGTGFFFGKFFTGTEFKLMYDAGTRLFPALNLVLGYRF